MTRLILAVIIVVAATFSAVPEYQPPGAGERAQAQRGTPHRAPSWGGVPYPAAVLETASEGSVPTTSMPGPASTHTIRGTATWYCGGGSPCTSGHSPSDLIAAIDPTTGIPKGSQLTVWHGEASVVVDIVDVCACPGARIIDLSRLAFARLADPSRGIIGVVLVPARGSADAVPKMTLPPTDTGETP